MSLLRLMALTLIGLGFLVATFWNPSTPGSVTSLSPVVPNAEAAQAYPTPESTWTPEPTATIQFGSTPPITPTPGAIFVVNSIQDSNDGFCDTNHCTLREAIIAANTNGSINAIHFNISGTGEHNINLSRPLPAITSRVYLDGSTQPGFTDVPRISINGQATDPGTYGLDLIAGASVIRGLRIAHFMGASAIRLRVLGGNVVEGNHLVDNAVGVLVENSDHNRIGGLYAAQRNIVSGNNVGILVQGNLAHANVIQGNYIGTNANGTLAIPNLDYGVVIEDAPHNVVGGREGTTLHGPCTGACNLIAGNNGVGILVENDDSVQNSIAGNYIGVDRTGMAALGNQGVGILVRASHNQIGGSDPDGWNVITANESGITIAGEQGAAATNNIVAGNIIGAFADHSPGPGNEKYGIFLLAFTYDNQIGGVTYGATNLVTDNLTGIALNGEATAFVGPRNSIRGNYIGRNTNLGIDLGNDGVTANDLNDADGGPNDYQNHPVLTSVTLNPSQSVLSIQGYLNSAPTIPYSLDFYVNDSCDLSGFGEGKYYQDTLTVLTDVTGYVTFTHILTSAFANLRSVSVTATDQNGNTSEFSNCLGPLIINPATPIATPTVTPTPTPTFRGAPTGTPSFPPTPTFTPAPTTDPLGVKPQVRRDNVWYQRYSLTSGASEREFSYGLPQHIPLMCDWDGNGSKTPGVFDGGAWHIKNDYSPSPPTAIFAYGVAGDIPVCGDWNGDGMDTPGIVRRGVWHLKNINMSGPADLMFMYGLAGDSPVVGDWNGNGVDTPGVVRGNVWYLRNQSTAGSATLVFIYGLPSDRPIVGDWNNNRSDTPGVYRAGVWFLRNSNTAGNADTVFSFGLAGDTPLVWR